MSEALRAAKATSAWPVSDGEAAALIREHDWTATPLGSVENWPDGLRVTVDMLLACSFPMIALWGPELIQIYNDGYAEIMAEKHPRGMGQPTRECWPEVWDFNRPVYDQVREGITLTFENQLFPITRHGSLEDAYFTLCYSPIRCEEGSVAGVLVTVFEVTGRMLAEQERDLATNRLKASEARLAAAFESVPVGLLVIDLTGTTVLSNAEFRRFLPSGTIPSRDPGHQGRWQAWDAQGTLLTPENYPGARAIRGERVVPGQDMLYTNDEGRQIWTNVATIPIREDSGKVTGQACVINDIDDERRAIDRLHESEMLRRVALAGGRMGTWRWNLDSQLIWGDAQFWTVWGTTPSDEALPLSFFMERMSPESGARVAAVVTSAIEKGEEFDGPLEIVSGSKAGHWFQWRGRAGTDDTSVLYGVTFDITGQKQAEVRIRESEEHKAVLLKLSDALNSFTDPIGIQQAAMKVLAEHLRLSRAFYFRVEHDEDGWAHVIDSDYCCDTSIRSMVGRHLLKNFGTQLFEQLAQAFHSRWMTSRTSRASLRRSLLVTKLLVSLRSSMFHCAGMVNTAPASPGRTLRRGRGKRQRST